MLFTVHQHGPPYFSRPQVEHIPTSLRATCLWRTSTRTFHPLLSLSWVSYCRGSAACLRRPHAGQGDETIGWRYPQQVTPSQSPFGLTISREAVCGGVPGDVAVCLSRHVAVAPAVTGPDYLPIDPPSPGRKEVFTCCLPAVYLLFAWCC